MTVPITPCRSCNAPVLRLKHIRTGSVSPIDADTSADGNIRVDREAGTWEVVPKGETHRYPGQLHKSHFASCPDSEAWRRGR